MGSKVVRRSVSVVIVGALVLLASCSSTSTQVSDKIAERVKEKTNLSTDPGVTCPDDAKAEKGETFTCDVDLAGTTIPVKVTFTDDSTFSMDLVGAVYKKDKLSSALQADLKKNGLALKSLDCAATDGLVVFTEKSTVDCAATTTDGGTGSIKVHIDKDHNAETVGTVYEQGALANFITQQLADQVTITTVDCGDEALIQATEDTSVECQATADDGSSATIKVALATDGTATITDVTQN